jgi:pimeloyl-ACP methyl ester carboxylesterase
VNPLRIGFRARDGMALSALDHPGDPHRTPILCLSGLTRTAADFDGLAGRHAPKRRVLALDHIGHGESQRPEALSRYAIEESLRDVLDAMAALHCHRAVIIGTSYGGILAMVLAVLRPTAIAGVLLNDVGPVLEPLGLDHVTNFVGRDPALPDLDACVRHLQAVLPPLTIDEAAWRHFAAGTYRAGEDGRWHPRWDTRIARVMGAAGAMPPLWGPFGALAHAPLLLVRGELSGLLSAATAQRMRDERPDMGFLNLPGTGHCPTLDERLVVPALDGFLDGIA